MAQRPRSTQAPKRHQGERGPEGQRDEGRSGAKDDPHSAPESGDKPEATLDDSEQRQPSDDV